MGDLVSIIMPNYNSGKYIGAAIESVLAQTYTDWQLLIVDDGSSDDSVRLIERYADNDNRIRLFSNQSNLGAAEARNLALKHAEGRWIAFLDSDDIWKEDKLEKQISFMEENGYAFSCSDYSVINEKGEVIAEYATGRTGYTYRDILKSNSIGCLTALIDREKISDIHMPVEAVKREDMACWLSVLKKCGSVHNYQKSLAYYRVHNSVSSNKTRMIGYQWNVYRRVEKIGFLQSVYYLACSVYYRLGKYR